VITINTENQEWLDRDGLAYFYEKLKIYLSSKYSSILFDTTDNWNKQTSLISENKTFYVYTDHLVDGDLAIPGFKIGDGKAYLIDMPFTDELYYRHILDSTIHITQDERLAWNDKISCKLSDDNAENLVLYK
jgi:hypothetical protein